MPCNSLLSTCLIRALLEVLICIAVDILTWPRRLWVCIFKPVRMNLSYSLQLLLQNSVSFIVSADDEYIHLKALRFRALHEDFVTALCMTTL